MCVGFLLLFNLKPRLACLAGMLCDVEMFSEPARCHGEGRMTQVALHCPCVPCTIAFASAAASAPKTSLLAFV